jgi:hypothetical protein
MSRRNTPPLRITVAPPGADACGCDERSARCEVSSTALDDKSMSALIAFFRLLDEWDREAKPQ